MNCRDHRAVLGAIIALSVLLVGALSAGDALKQAVSRWRLRYAAP